MILKVLSAQFSLALLRVLIEGETIEVKNQDYASRLVASGVCSAQEGATTQEVAAKEITGEVEGSEKPKSKNGKNKK